MTDLYLAFKHVMCTKTHTGTHTQTHNELKCTPLAQTKGPIVLHMVKLSGGVGELLGYTQRSHKSDCSILLCES